MVSFNVVKVKFAGVQSYLKFHCNIETFAYNFFHEDKIIS